MAKLANSNNDDLRGKHAVVTGGGKGIGATIARSLSLAGAKVTLMGRDLSALESTAAELDTAQSISVDITDEKAVTQCFADAEASYGATDILVNNAGAAESSPITRTDSELWRRMMEVNLDGVFYACRAALPSMLSTGHGRIINIASTAGLSGYPYVSAYCAAKHGVIGLTKSIAIELVRKNITVNALCPGYVETELLQRSIDNIVEKTNSSEDDARATLQAVNPQNRFVQPEEIAATVLWLCSPGAESVTGQAIALAGGEIL